MNIRKPIGNTSWTTGRVVMLTVTVGMILTGICYEPLYGSMVVPSQIWWPFTFLPIGLYVYGGCWLLEIAEPKKEIYETCYCCGSTIPKNLTVMVVTSSDPRSSPTPCCKRCWGERFKKAAAALMLFTCLPALSQDLYVNFDDIAAGTTDASINMGTISKTNGNAVTFAWTGSAGKVSVENGGMGYGLLTPVTVGGTAYTNQSFTKHLLCKSDDTVSIQQMFTWTFAASRKAAFGFFITISNYTGLGSFYTIGGLKTGSSYNVLSLVNNSPPYMQNEGLNSPYGENINVANNVPIWVTGWWDSNNGTANNRSRMYFYNATNWTLIGFSIYPDVTLNETVNTFQWGIQDAHSKNAGTTYRLGAAIVHTNAAGPIWPGGKLQIPTNSSSTAVTAALAAASNGDTVLLPATNQTWTSGVTVSKNNMVIASVLQNKWGTNETRITADGSFTAFPVTGTLNTISNFQVLGDLSNDEATAFENIGAHNRYSHMYLRELDIAMYAQNFGLMDNCVVADNHFMSRNIFGNSFFDIYFPLAWDSTNFFVYEDNHFYWTSAKNASGSQPWMSSQEAQAFVIRHNYVSFNKASTQIQPWVDYHGDHDPISTPDRRPGLGLQIYSNYIVDVIGTTISGSKFVDVRGGRSLIYSNRWVGSSFSSGDGIVYREEHPEDSPDYRVNNSYSWQNKHGASGTTSMPFNDDANLTDGVDYFSTPLDPLVQIPYPHPARAESAQGGFPTPTVPARIGIGRASVRATSP